MDLVKQRIDAEIECLLVAEIAGEIGPQIVLVYIKRKFIRRLGDRLAGNTIVIAIIARRKRAVQLVVENMLPFQGEILVPVSIKGVAVQIEPVPAQITGDI